MACGVRCWAPSGYMALSLEAGGLISSGKQCAQHNMQRGLRLWATENVTSAVCYYDDQPVLYFSPWCSYGNMEM